MAIYKEDLEKLECRLKDAIKCSKSELDLTSLEDLLTDIKEKLCEIAEKPVIDIDYEYKCNSDTGFYDACVIVVTDGVAAEPVVTPTDIPCDSEIPDVEKIRICKDGTIHIQICSFDKDGVKTLIEEIDTFEACDGPCEPMQGSDLDEFHTYNIHKPPCCVILVKTSAGEVTLPEGLTTYSASFDCTVTDFSVEILKGDCTVSDIWVDLIKKN